MDGTIRDSTALRLLLVDDSRGQRLLLARQLRGWGYAVTEAASGGEALEICRRQEFDIILSDWMMPGLTGPDFCRAFRALPLDRYAYFILLTAKSEKSEVAGGLDGGADDFLTKPVDMQELRARLRAGERILKMQAELVAKNTALSRLHAALERDLEQARRLQAMPYRDRDRAVPGGRISLLMRPSGHVGGDLVGSVDLGPGRVGLLAVDVAGHGVASAMVAARLAALLQATPDRSIAFARGRDGRPSPVPPGDLAAALNRLMIEDFAVEHYATLVFADVDLRSGWVRMVQAGHPHPLLVRAGRVRRLGRGGYPVGLVAGVGYPAVRFRLRPGDRLLIPSDGITECPGAAGDLGEEGLAALLPSLAAEPGPAALDALVAGLTVHHGGGDFPDDLSAVLFDYAGP